MVIKLLLLEVRDIIYVAKHGNNKLVNIVVSTDSLLLYQMIKGGLS